LDANAVGPALQVTRSAKAKKMCAALQNGNPSVIRTHLKLVATIPPETGIRPVSGETLS
jgi:hypothetical protein